MSIDPADLDALAATVQSMVDELGSINPVALVPTGSAALDGGLGELATAFDQVLIGLGAALGAHGRNATMTALWYRRVEQALAVGR